MDNKRKNVLHEDAELTVKSTVASMEFEGFSISEEEKKFLYMIARGEVLADELIKDIVEKDTKNN